jgi:hypothetical protein
VTRAEVSAAAHLASLKQRVHLVVGALHVLEARLVTAIDTATTAIELAGIVAASDEIAVLVLDELRLLVADATS